MRSLFAACVMVPSFAFANCASDAMLVFDASSSMSAPSPGISLAPRITDARSALREALPMLAQTRRIGLIVYGPGETQGCSHVDLRFAPLPDAADRIISEIDNLAPDGSTALTRAVRDAANVLASDSAPQAPTGTIVLVTDGEETCGGRTCQVARDLVAQAPGITVHVIGFRMRETYLKGVELGQDQDPVGAHCLAVESGGLYLPTQSIDELAEALRETLGCALSS